MRYRKDFESNTEAISAVIGVILMVAIAVAMAGVAYAYFSGLIGDQQEVTPTFSFISNTETNTLVITQMEKPTDWHDLKIMEIQGSTSITIQNQTGPKSGPITVGEAFLINGHGLSGTVNVAVVYIPTGTMVSEITFYEVTA